MKRFFFQAGIVTITACRMIPAAPPVPVQGIQADLLVLSGEWSGRYWSKETTRHGTIRFTLPEHADTGFGEVEIMFSPSLYLLRQASAEDELAPQPRTVLDIKLVRVEGNRVRGSMAPYWDPDCDCQARTTFEGAITADRIDGSFSTHRATSDRPEVTGKWEATREGGTS